jgi:hypothetical protein
MYSIQRPYIVYSLPASKVWQPLKSKKIGAAYQEILVFLRHVTNADPEKPREVGFEIHPLLEAKIEDTTLKQILSDSAPQQRGGTWSVDSNRLGELINYFERNQKRFENSYDEQMKLSYSFYLTNPETNQVLGGQELLSGFTVYFSKTQVCLPTLFFPFPEANNSFWNYIDCIKYYLPFILDERFLRQARLKDGQPSSFKKVSR